METTEETKPGAGVILRVLTFLLDHFWSRFYSCVCAYACIVHTVDQQMMALIPLIKAACVRPRVVVFSAAI